MSPHTEIAIEEGSTNAYADLGYSNAAEMQRKSQLAAEIARAIKQARAIFAYGSENISNQGFWLGYAEMFATYEWFQTYLEKLAKVTVKDVQRVANEYFQDKSRVVGTYVPTDGKA